MDILPYVDSLHLLLLIVGTLILNRNCGKLFKAIDRCLKDGKDSQALMWLKSDLRWSITGLITLSILTMLQILSMLRYYGG
jgi:hypothetical protein